jgi:putative addiction module CopG family antidote
MDDRTITVSISNEEDEFIAGQISAGNFSDENAIIKAGLAALERETKLRELRGLIAEGDADIAAGRVHAFDTSEDMMRAVVRRAKSRS